jgi:hypothetical protein
MIAATDIPPDLLDLGMFVGLLGCDGGGVTVNHDWFSHPTGTPGPSLADLGSRFDHLVALLTRHLTPDTDHHPLGARWFRIPDGTGAAGAPEPTPLCLVHTPAANKAPDQLGIGALAGLVVGDAALDVFAHLPILSYDRSGAKLLLDSAAHPLTLGVTVTAGSKRPFATTGGATFNAVIVTAGLCLDTSIAPSLNVTFEQPTGALAGWSYTHPDGLLQPPALPALEAVLTALGAPVFAAEMPFAPLTVGDLLTGIGLLRPVRGGAMTLDFEDFLGQPPLEVALNLLVMVLDAFTEGDTSYDILPLPGRGTLRPVRQDNPDATSDYGINVTFGARIGGGELSAPAVDVTLGGWLKDETDDANWVSRCLGNQAAPPAGLTVWLLRRQPDYNVEVRPGLALTSAGISVTGGGQGPLVDVGGYTFFGVELRAMVDIPSGRFDNPDAWLYGFAAGFDTLGFPVGPSLGSATGQSRTNPVAQSVLQSGSPDAQGAATRPVNPTFSANAGWIRHGGFEAQIFDQDGRPARDIRIPLHQAVGPLQCTELGVGWSDPHLLLEISGGLVTSGLTVELDGLTVGVPIRSPADFAAYTLDVDGFAIAFSKGDIELAGALKRIDRQDSKWPAYEGMALIKASDFAIGLVGAYAYQEQKDLPSGGYASLFLFGLLDADLGGPAFFYVTGLALGFGYNRRLELPEQDAVPAFPLVAGLSDPKALLGNAAKPDPETALAKLDHWVPPTQGAYWIAAGVRFTSFDLINSSALLVVEFGTELEIALLGISWMSLPPPPGPGKAAPDKRYAYVELGIEVKVLPAQGVFSATAILSPNSYVIDPACKLTGGFAFFVWFGENPHAGEFVLTVGGYHPDFKPPAHYPRVPRLGFAWPVTQQVTISGEAYLALTPSAVMLGGGLQVLFDSGDLHAWLKAEMHALIQWAPLHYELEIKISIGVSYHLHFLFVDTTLRIELGAKLELWGPRMGGEVHVDWFVISFTVGFGAARTERGALEWSTPEATGFADTMLPAGSAKGDGVFSITVSDGLAGTQGDAWLVRPNNFSFSVTTAIPLTNIAVTRSDKTTADLTRPVGAASRLPWAPADFKPAKAVPVRPLQLSLAKSELLLTVTEHLTGKIYALDEKFVGKLARADLPAAKWGKLLDADADPEYRELAPDQLVGLRSLTPKPPALTPGGADALDMELAKTFGYVVVNDDTSSLPLTAGSQQALKLAAVDKPQQAIAAALTDDGVSATRKEVFDALRAYGSDPGTNDALGTVADDPLAYFTGDPLLAA